MTPSDVKIVADHINDFIELPNGINRLRKAVLTLAVSGQLVEQHENEGTAEDLYTQIQVERAEFDISRRKKVRVLNPITDDEVPFDLPSTWKWVRIREITHDYEQKTPDKDFYYVDVSSINSSKGEVAEPKLIKPSEASSRARKIVQDGSVIYSGIRPYLLNTALVNSSEYDKEVIVSTAFFVLKPFGNISSEFVHLIVRSPYFDQLANQACVGAAYPAINDDKFEKLPFPLPPLPEQERIVRRVKEVMSQLDELESQKNERDLVRSRLTRSAMQALGSADSKVAFEQLTQLVKTNSDVDELEKAIRSLSVFGYLTNKPTQEDIPADWKWTDWGDLLSGDKYSMKRGPFGSALRKDFFVSDGIKVYEQYNAIHDVDRERYFISEEKYKELEAFTVRPGDLIISCSGTLGRIAELHKDSKIGVINQALLKITLNKKLISNEYFILLFRSDFIQKRIYEEALGTAMTNMVNVKTLKKIALPIPPLKEQQQIVKKFNELKRMLDNLKTIIIN